MGNIAGQRKGETYPAPTPGSVSPDADKVKVNVGDASADFLDAKVQAGIGVVLDTVDEGGGDLALVINGAACFYERSSNFPSFGLGLAAGAAESVSTGAISLPAGTKIFAATPAPQTVTGNAPTAGIVYTASISSAGLGITLTAYNATGGPLSPGTIDVAVIYALSA